MHFLPQRSCRVCTGHTKQVDHGFAQPASQRAYLLSSRRCNIGQQTSVSAVGRRGCSAVCAPLFWCRWWLVVCSCQQRHAVPLSRTPSRRKRAASRRAALGRLAHTCPASSGSNPSAVLASRINTISFIYKLVLFRQVQAKPTQARASKPAPIFPYTVDRGTTALLLASEITNHIYFYLVVSN